MKPKHKYKNLKILPLDILESFLQKLYHKDERFRENVNVGEVIFGKSNRYLLGKICWVEFNLDGVMSSYADNGEGFEFAIAISVVEHIINI